MIAGKKLGGRWDQRIFGGPFLGLFSFIPRVSPPPDKNKMESGAWYPFACDIARSNFALIISLLLCMYGGALKCGWDFILHAGV